MTSKLLFLRYIVTFVELPFLLFRLNACLSIVYIGSGYFKFIARIMKRSIHSTIDTYLLTINSKDAETLSSAVLFNENPQP